MTLRLADAILLGDSLKRCEPDRWLNDDGSCGCALGGALLAAGVTPLQFRKEMLAANGDSFERFSELPSVTTRWPFLTLEAIRKISTLYIRKSQGRATIEQIADYADSIDPTPRCEPPVQEPSQVETRQESTVSHG